MTQLPVIICGAGPSGLTAALFLARQGIPVHVLERGHTIFDDPRAATFHPPTLEMYEASGVTARLHDRGIVTRFWQFWDRSEGLIAEFDMDVLSGDTRYPYRMQCEQHKLVRILHDALRDFPNALVEFNAEVTDVVQHEDHVVVVLGDRVIRGSYVLGADGGRSVVRKSQDIGFEGFTYDERFLVVTTSFDFATLGYSYSNYVSDPREWAALFKVPGNAPPGIWRVVFPVPLHEPEALLLSPDHAQERLLGFLPQDIPYEILHLNLYQVHQRVATQFRKDRVFLSGDAAHVNNPLGGMGMNFGIHDAINFAEKLGAVINDGAPDDVLNRYDRQRRTVANQYLQAMTIQNKQTLEERDLDVRRQRQAELHAITQDPVRMRAHLLKTAMLEGVRAAAAIP